MSEEVEKDRKGEGRGRGSSTSTPLIPFTSDPPMEYSNYRVYQTYYDPLTLDSQVANNTSLPSLHQKYASWCLENGAQYSSKEIRDIFDTLTEKFGFQEDNCDNMFDHLMVQLDSRSSRMPCPVALLSLHSDYIGGDRANYKKWYFSAHYELDEKINSNIFSSYKEYLEIIKTLKGIVKVDETHKNKFLILDYKWKTRMLNLTPEDYLYQLALYLLIWGEANNVRFMPECLCFIFKCSLDFLQNPIPNSKINFLNDVITPIYKFIRNQQYKLIDGTWVKTSKDHVSIIGYDDVNQFFWFPENLKKIKLVDSSLLLDYDKNKRILLFKSISWNSFLYKTFKERRSWFHLLTNFSRVWIIHVCMFWYYTSFNSPNLYTKDYNLLLDNQPAPQVQWSIVSLAGTLACLIAVFAAIFEFQSVPRRFPGAQPLLSKLVYLTFILIVNAAPTVYILGFLPTDVYSVHGRFIGIAQFVISCLTVIYLSITPPTKLFSSITRFQPNFLKASLFTASFPKIAIRGQVFSILLWVSVFLLKFFESYIFLTLSLRDPIRVLSTIDLSRCRGDVIFGSIICRYQAKLLLGLLLITDLVLFFLDTYLWYIIMNCVFSIFLSFSLGISVFTPWRNIFVRLPERIYSKLIFVEKEANVGAITMIAQIWNSVIISMYRDHFLSLEQVNKLVYQFLEDDETFGVGNGKTFVKAPLFFLFQDDNSFHLSDFFTPGKEAERRISFFAQSLSSPITEPIPTASLPSFTVLVPHYSEKILLSLKEIIKEDKGSKVSVLDYLKQLNKQDWDSFVQDTKILDNLDDNSSEAILFGSADEYKTTVQSIYDDLPYYCIGFKNSSSEHTLRTRIWASLRSQTLYRTVSGFTNYENAIKILYKLEDNNFSYKSANYPEEYETELSKFVDRKFRLLISLQRYQYFEPEEIENIKVLFEIFPNIHATYLEEDRDPDTNEIIYYSTLLNLKETDSNGNYGKKYRIKLSGNPILGDGKSDNQNHALIFYRGEYIQVIDANQDNYIEECLKIKAVLSEFEEYNLDYNDYEYLPTVFGPPKDTVAIIGAREYIFSENIGVLGDIAAAKEQTFGTLFARTLAEIGGKLHYGHPDLLNGIFMTTRGGISKAQRGLHLNEDIYAGMMAISRGGRIKHCDYFQCGKGRDLGLNTILNFTIKIGAGMGEQILSREHYYLGTSLQIDRFLSFYYAHAGFHLNNLFISISSLLFMMVMICLGSMNHEVIICNYDQHKPITDVQEPIGCYNLQPVLNWVSRFVLSVFICFFISFLPLLFQELVEKGVIHAFLRMIYHLVSLSPIFEVFVCQIYAKSLKDNISIGGAKYVATGRGFATARQPFSGLYSTYASLSTYKGAMFFLTVMFSCITMWQPALMWFFISFLSMCLAPLIFNPHQFLWVRFFTDYRDFIRWLSRGNSKNHTNSWYSFQKAHRAKSIGYKKKVLGEAGKKVKDNSKRISTLHKIFDRVVLPLFPLFFNFASYMFINSQTGVKDYKPVNPFFRIVIVSLLPIVINSLVLVVLAVFSCILGPILFFRKFSAMVATISHFFAVFITIVNFELLLYMESWNFPRTIVGFIVMIHLHRILRDITYMFLSKELKDDFTNSSWWSGKWITSGLGALVFTQPIREMVIKVSELMLFGYDFILCHCILFSISPLLFIPFIDKLHTIMLFWSKYNKKQFRSAIASKRFKKKTESIAIRYGILFFTLLLFLIGLILVPIFCAQYIPSIEELNMQIPEMVVHLVQPNNQNNDDTGSNAPDSVQRGKPPAITMSTIF